MKKERLLRMIGEKMATASIDPRCWPLKVYQPKPPAKIQQMMSGKAK